MPAVRTRSRTRGFARSDSSDVPPLISGLKAWFDPRTTDWITIATGISAWVSRAGSLGSVALPQATGGNQPAYATAVASLGGRNAVQFDGTNDFLKSATASLWNFLHNGSGSSIFMVWLSDSAGGATQTFLNTGQTTVQVGFQIALEEATPNLVVRVYDGDGVNVTIARNPAGTIAAQDVAKWTVFSLDTNAGTYGSGYSDGPGGAVSAPSASDAFTGLILGTTQTATTNPLKGYVAQLAFYDRILTAADRSRLAAWAAAQYGVAA